LLAEVSNELLLAFEYNNEVLTQISSKIFENNESGGLDVDSVFACGNDNV
jgi:hypothetical protein